MNERGMHVLGALDSVAARHQSLPAAVALAWLLARPSVTAPIVSATSMAQLDTLVSAIDLQLEAADIAQLNEASN
jgi:aryl-alcohol dehydrogenase-like predicted oxidoreductase